MTTQAGLPHTPKSMRSSDLMLWTMLFSYPMMAAVEEICGRIGPGQNGQGSSFAETTRANQAAREAPDYLAWENSVLVGCAPLPAIGAVPR
jgi:hypothetical protein